MAMACVQRKHASTREARCLGRELNREAREGETGRYRVAERSVIATKRVTTVERRGLTFRATMERLKRSAIGQRPSNQNSVWTASPVWM